MKVKNPAGCGLSGFFSAVGFAEQDIFTRSKAGVRCEAFWIRACTDDGAGVKRDRRFGASKGARLSFIACKVSCSFNARLLRSQRYCSMYPRFDADISSTSAQGAGHGFIDLLIARIWIFLQESSCRHDLTRLAESTMGHA